MIVVLRIMIIMIIGIVTIIILILMIMIFTDIYCHDYDHKYVILWL